MLIPCFGYGFWWVYHGLHHQKDTVQMWTNVQQVLQRNIRMYHVSIKTYPMIPPPAAKPHSSPSRPMLALLSTCQPEVQTKAETQKLSHALNLTTGNLWNSWKIYCISSELSLGAFWWHGRGCTYWNILKLSNRLVKVSTFRIYCTTSLGPKTLQRKIQHGASSEGQKMYCHEVGISSSRGHVFGHECWVCQGKPLHTTLWRPMIGGKSQEDAHQ